MPLADLVVPGVGLARDGRRDQPAAGLSARDPRRRSSAREPAGAAVYAPAGRMLGARRADPLPRARRHARAARADGPEPFYRGDIAAAIAAKVEGEGGTVGRRRPRRLRDVAREPVRAGFAGCEILTNPPPSSGGILIAYALELLGGSAPTEGRASSRRWSRPRTRGPASSSPGSTSPASRRRFLADRLGSTTHITALDGEGGCASVTCSNGSGSGVFVDGHRDPAQQHARRGGPEPVRLPRDRRRAADAVDDVADDRPSRRRARARARQRRLEPDPLGGLADDHPLPRRGARPRRGRRRPARALRGRDGPRRARGRPGGARRLEQHGYEVVRWREPSLFFGGVHAVAAGHGRPEAAGDPRRGGAVAWA